LRGPVGLIRPTHCPRYSSRFRWSGQRAFSPLHRIGLEGVDLVALKAAKIGPAVGPEYGLHALVAVRASIHIFISHLPR
jgi:hypothetical protein